MNDTDRCSLHPFSKLSHTINSSCTQRSTPHLSPSSSLSKKADTRTRTHSDAEQVSLHLVHLRSERCRLIQWGQQNTRFCEHQLQGHSFTSITLIKEPTRTSGSSLILAVLMNIFLYHAVVKEVFKSTLCVENGFKVPNESLC